MPKTTRAKFRCTRETQTRWNAQMDPQHAYEFEALYDTSIPEDQRYAKSTPIGGLKLVVDNPAVSFTPGAAYYLDISPADEG